MQRKAIILSAGQGKRLSPLTDTRPKCLIELSGASVLHWQLSHLAAAGIQEAVVVTGFGADAVDADIAAHPVRGLSVRTLFNPFYSVSDNLATCWMIRHEMEGGFLLLNGDTLFEPAIAQRLLAAPTAPITLAVDRKPSYDSDDMKVRSTGSTLLEIGKTIEIYDAESIGFLRFSPEGGAAFAKAVDAALHRPEGLKRWYLSVIDQLARETGKVTIESIQGLGWAEMDFHEDIARNLELTEQWTAAMQVAV
jgi:choline kinase